MSDKEQDKVLNHDYDGIQEYDNDLPKWWVQIFWITGIFGIIYAVYFHWPSTPTPTEDLAMQMEEISKLKALHSSSQSSGGGGEDALLSLVGNTEALKTGAGVYQAKCMACHAAQGQGLVGPNLTDEYWIHGGSLPEIRQVIRKGVPEKGMLSWEPLLKSEEIDAVTVYIWSLYGSNPPNPKAPQGEKVERK
jgi:cytochrome c oxidase cbb3-type subunit 3